MGGENGCTLGLATWDEDTVQIKGLIGFQFLHGHLLLPFKNNNNSNQLAPLLGFFFVIGKC